MVKIEDFKKIPIGSKFYVQCYQELDGYLLMAENGTSVIVSGLNENDEPFKMAKKYSKTLLNMDKCSSKKRKKKNAI